MSPLPTRESYCGCTTPVAAVISPSDGPSAPASESPPIQSRIGANGVDRPVLWLLGAARRVMARAVRLDALRTVRERRTSVGIRSVSLNHSAARTTTTVTIRPVMMRLRTCRRWRCRCGASTS